MTPTKQQINNLIADIDGLRVEADRCREQAPDSLACMYASAKMKAVADRLQILFERIKEKEKR